MRPHPLLLALLSTLLLAAAAPATAQVPQGQASVHVEVAAPGAPVAPDRLSALDVDVTLVTDRAVALAQGHARVELEVVAKPDWLTAVLSPAVLTVAPEPAPTDAAAAAAAWPGRAKLVLVADRGGAPGDVGEVKVLARLPAQGLLPMATQTVAFEVVRGEGACVASPAPAPVEAAAPAPVAARAAPPQGQAQVMLHVAEPEAPISPDRLTSLDVEIHLVSDPFSALVDRTARVELRVLAAPGWLTAAPAPDVLTIPAELREGSSAAQWRGTATLALLADRGGAPGDVGKIALEARVLPGHMLPEVSQVARLDVTRGEGACDAVAVQAASTQEAPDARVPAPALAAPLAAVAGALLLRRRP